MLEGFRVNLKTFLGLAMYNQHCQTGNMTLVLGLIFPPNTILYDNLHTVHVTYKILTSGNNVASSLTACATPNVCSSNFNTICFL